MSAPGEIVSEQPMPPLVEPDYVDEVSNQPTQPHPAVQALSGLPQEAASRDHGTATRDGQEGIDEAMARWEAARTAYEGRLRAMLHSIGEPDDEEYIQRQAGVLTTNQLGPRPGSEGVPAPSAAPAVSRNAPTVDQLPPRTARLIVPVSQGHRADAVVAVEPVPTPDGGREEQGPANQTSRQGGTTTLGGDKGAASVPARSLGGTYAEHAARLLDAARASGADYNTNDIHQQAEALALVDEELANEADRAREEAAAAAQNILTDPNTNAFVTNAILYAGLGSNASAEQLIQALTNFNANKERFEADQRRAMAAAHRAQAEFWRQVTEHAHWEVERHAPVFESARVDVWHAEESLRRAEAALAEARSRHEQAVTARTEAAARAERHAQARDSAGRFAVAHALAAQVYEQPSQQPAIV